LEAVVDPKNGLLSQKKFWRQQFIEKKGLLSQKKLETVIYQKKLT